MQVYEIMNVDIKTISKDSSILEAMKIMKEKNTDFLIIIEDGKILGEITEHDIFLNLTKEISTSTKIKKIMKQYVLTINENDDVIEASDLMGRCLTKKLIVINDERNLTGILTLEDIARNEYCEEFALDVLVEISCANQTNFNTNNKNEQISAFIF